MCLDVLRTQARTRGGPLVAEAELSAQVRRRQHDVAEAQHEVLVAAGEGRAAAEGDGQQLRRDVHAVRRVVEGRGGLGEGVLGEVEERGVVPGELALQAAAGEPCRRGVDGDL